MIGKPESFVVLITIDTEDVAGPAAVYGHYEIERILEKGASELGYKVVANAPINHPIPVTDKSIRMTVFIKGAKE